MIEKRRCWTSEGGLLGKRPEILLLSVDRKGGPHRAQEENKEEERRRLRKQELSMASLEKSIVTGDVVAGWEKEIEEGGTRKPDLRQDAKRPKQERESTVNRRLVLEKKDCGTPTAEGRIKRSRKVVNSRDEERLNKRKRRGEGGRRI